MQICFLSRTTTSKTQRRTRALMKVSPEEIILIDWKGFFCVCVVLFEASPT